MKASELVVKVQNLIDEHGDLKISSEFNNSNLSIIILNKNGCIASADEKPFEFYLEL